MIFYLYYNYLCACRRYKFLAPLLVINLSKYQVNLVKVAKYFCLLFIFHSIFYGFDSVAFVLSGRSSLLYEVHLHTNPMRRLQGLFA